MTDLTPESEYLVATIDEDTTLDELRSHLAAIEAAAIARDREGPVTEHADPRYRPLMLAVRAADEAYEKAGDAGTKTWLDDYFLPELTTHGLTVRLLALDAPEAQCRCGHAQRVHVTDVDWDEHSGCTSTGCDCRLFAIPEAQDGKEGSGG
jgi:hypothetical protein